MGKDLNNKLLPKGIVQRKDGRYYARYECRTTGKRTQKYFKNPYDAAKWLEEIRYKDTHGLINSYDEITVNQWFNDWIKNKEVYLRPNTIRNYNERYYRNIKPFIANIKLSNLTDYHTTKVLTEMIGSYKSSTIVQTYICMGTMLKAAMKAGIISRVPIEDGILQKICPREPKKARFLTLDEQRRFLEAIKGTSNEAQCRLILNTGLRTAELIGLKWEDIELDADFPVIHVKRNLEYRHSRGEWLFGPPKSSSGYRTIPIPTSMVEMLTKMKNERVLNEETPEEFKDIVFLNRKGMPTKNSTYDTYLYKICEKSGLEHFSMHTLRHTYATRCVESRMDFKTLSAVLGHATIKTTLDIYTHLTLENGANQIAQFEEYMRSSKL